jgi:hypothetical protein
MNSGRAAVSEMPILGDVGALRLDRGERRTGQAGGVDLPLEVFTANERTGLLEDVLNRRIEIVVEDSSARDDGAEAVSLSDR